MDVAIAGGHGQIGFAVGRMLAAGGDRVRGLVRDTRHADELRGAGIEPVALDLEADDTTAYASAIEGADAVLFAAGAGPGSGAERKETVDYGAAVKLADAATDAGVGRYLMISAMGTDDPPSGDDVFEVYLRAKARADAYVMDSGLDWTIVRPGRLTDDEPTGRISLARHVDRGEVSRLDVASLLVRILDEPTTAGHIVEVVGGTTPIAEAVRAVATSD